MPHSSLKHLWFVYDFGGGWINQNISKVTQNNEPTIWTSPSDPLTANVFAQKPVTQMKDLVLFCQTVSPPSIIHIQQITTRLAKSLRISLFFQSLIFKDEIFQTIGLYIKTALISTLTSLSIKFYRRILFFFQSDTEFGRMSWGIGANFLVSLLRVYGNKK